MKWRRTDSSRTRGRQVEPTKLSEADLSRKPAPPRADRPARKGPPLPKSVVFDVGNVLLSWDPHAILRDHLPAGADHGHFLRNVFSHEDWVELDRGTLDEEDAILRFVARSGATPELVRRLVHASKTSLTPMPESLALLEELRRTGATKLYVLSNMSHTTWEYLAPRHDFWKGFDGLVISAQIRMVKPDRAIYRHMLSTFALDPAETVFFDDRPDNVAGARAEQIKAFLFDGAAKARARLFDGSWRE
jgi:putative hydrolase of the HAD superfamily